MKFLLPVFFAFLVPAVLAPPGAWAAPLVRLGLTDALNMAEANALRREEFDEAQRFLGQREREEWRRLAVPALTLQQTERTGNLTGQEQNRTTEARVDYLLYAGGRDRAGYESTRHASAANRFQRAQALAEVRLATAEAYLRFASTRQRIRSLELAAEAAAEEVKNAQRRTQLGLRTGLEVLQAKVVLADQRLELTRELQRQQELALQLTHLVREAVSPETQVEIDVDVGPAPRAPAYYREWAESHHPAVLLAREERKKAEQEWALRRAVRYPEVLLSAGFADSGGENESRSVALSLVYRFGGHHADIGRTVAQATIEQRFFEEDPSVGVTELAFVEERDVETTRYGVTFFDFRDTAASAESALLEARLNRVRAGRLAIEAREERTREIEQRMGELLAARAGYEVEILRVEKNEAELKAFRKAYDAGTVRYEELLEKQRALTTSRLERINARVDVRLSLINLHSAAGLPLLSP
jgi:outer membrane protein TolC